MAWELGPWGQDVAIAAPAGSMLPSKPGSLSMGSFMAKGRDQGPKRRRGNRHTMKRSGFPKVEFLEERQLLSGPDQTPPPLWTPTSTNLFDAQNGPMANLGVGSVAVYQAFVQGQGNTSGLAAEFPTVEFNNGLVGLQVKSLGGDFTQFVTSLQNLGMEISASSALYGLVDGFAPVNDLPTIAEMAQTQSGQLIYKPVTYAGNFQGVANNEAQTSLFADVARTQFGVDGTGVNVGVISDSVSQFAGGLADSYKTGDLSSSSPVTVIQDGAAGGTDEGRAMLENIHDIAPGSNLAFATAEGGVLNFANNIGKLASTAKSNLISDDIGYADDPMFQDGVISQSINTVTSQGVTYFSAAGNTADQGYLSTFRGVNGTVKNIGTGTFMNFNPVGGPSAANLQLPITTDGPNALIVFEYDQPWQTQEPAGSPGKVTSNVNIYVLDSSGNVVVGAAANNNNVAIQEPWQFIEIPSAGSYTVAIQVVSGSNPGHVEFVNFNENVNLKVSQQYGSAGGTFYTTSFGHATGVNTIGVGATPWWAPAPYLGQTPLFNEPFSSLGPAIYDLNVDGTPMSTPQVVQNPTITAPDGGNTSFFPPGGIIDTSTPPFPGEPATTTNLSQNLPSFFGTSSATPNAEAVAALMLQKVPNLTPAEIRQGLIAGALPMNNTPAGSWNQQSGFGLVNAIRSINAVDVLRVVATNPANGAVVTSAPGAITVTFNKPVNFATVSAADLVFTGTPPGVSVTVGTPIAVDNPTDPTIIQFPFSFSKPVGTLANGTYTFMVQGPVVSQDGKSLNPSGPISFTLADTTAPRIINTAESGRIVTIQFDKALDPATVTLANIFVSRGNGDPTFARGINLNSDPRAKISYNPQTFTVTLDYSGLPQTEMPTDYYLIAVLSRNGASPGVTDLVGNSLNGQFTGTFPSGTTPQGSVSFVQVLGLEVLAAPQITTFVMSPASDSGIPNDQNTMVSQPVLVGQVFAPFPATAANDPVYVEFSGLHGGTTDLAPGGGGRGFVGTFDAQVATDANGVFTVTPPSTLTEGFQYATAVVVGQPDQPPLPGFSSSLSNAFRIDTTPPQITGASFTPGGPPLPLPNGGQPNVTFASGLTTLTLNVQDPVNQQNSPFETPAVVLFPAIDPSTAVNISNYSLINTATNTDESSFITTATFVPGTPITGTDVNGNHYIIAYTGQINLTFAPGLPSGSYQFIAHTHELQYPGLADAAGNFLDDTGVPGEGTKDFVLNLAIGSTPVFVTNLQIVKANGTTSGPRSYFELPGPGGTNVRDGVVDPAIQTPTAIVVSLSNPIPYANYSNDLQLIRSADSLTSAPDGDFGNLGQGGLGSTGTGFTIVGGTTVYLFNNGTQVQPGGTGNQLVLVYSGTLPADYYRIYMPNQVEAGGTDTRIFDIYGNQLDGEFLGDQTATGAYEDLLPNGQYRQGMSGDGVPGGAFTTGFAVVPYGNVVYARPDYVENSLLPSTLSDGSLAKPYPVLAPEGDPNSPLANNPTHNPNLGLNNPGFFLSGFNKQYDRSGDGQFEQSALYAASQLSFNGPVVVVALPGTPSRNPVTGAITQATFVMQAPAGSNPTINNGSAAVPFDTTLVFTPGSTLKLLNAALFVQNQGSALQANGTALQPVTFTSYNDATIGGATNNNPVTTPRGGDWGGIVFRNYDEAITAQQVPFPVGGVNGVGSGIPVGPSGGPAVSGAQDALSVFNFTNINYAGGSVPQGSSTFYSGITLFNARPAITNSQISHAGGTGGTEAAIGEDFNSLREDDTARGPLVRHVTVTANVLNGIYLMAGTNGLIEPTNAVPYPTNPSTLGGSANYTLGNPLPYLVLAPIVVGQELLENTGGNTDFVGDRLYIQPGMMMKFDLGASLDVMNPAASLNVGSRSYINGFDQNNNYSPDSPNFVPETAADAEVLFTTIHDDTATTFFVDPTTGQQTIIVPAINATGEATTPPLGPAMWGSVGIQSGAIAVINHAAFKYGGGLVHTPAFSIQSQSVLAFLSGLNASSGFNTPGTASPDLGSHVYITNNDFNNNFDAAMQIDPNGLLAGDPLRPLVSGHPFFRNNVLKGNGIDGLAVVTSRSYLTTVVGGQYIGPVEAVFGPGGVNQTVSTVWDATDLTYVLRGTIILGGAYDFFGTTSSPPVPNLTAYTAIPKPALTLTIQSALPGTPLADGSTIPSPGQSVVVKLLSDENPNGDGSLAQFGSTGSSGINQASENAGAGFIVGVDDGVDPPTSPLVDPGAYSQIRILGIPGNQTTGQQRVPVIISSLRDGTVGVTARGVQEFNIFNSWPTQDFRAPLPGMNLPGTTTALLHWYEGQSTTTPQPGDGGYIYIGGNSLTSYDLTDPRQGSIIDDADISYMSRIEIQGGGIIDSFNIDGKPGAPTITDTDWYDNKAGLGERTFTGPVGSGAYTGGPITQLNSAMAMTISNSNLANFQDAAVFTHPDAANALARDWTGATSNAVPPPVTRSGLRGQAVDLYMFNDVVYNLDTTPLTNYKDFAEGVHINSESTNDSSGESPMMAVIINSTFYQDLYGIRTTAPTFNGQNLRSHVNVLSMNDIFDGATDFAVAFEGTGGDNSTGVVGESQLQYDLFWNNVDTHAPLGQPNPVNPANVLWLTNDGDFLGNNAPLEADPQFVNPAAGNFQLKPTSPAINAGRSEIGPLPAGDMIFPTDNQLLTSQVGIRTDPNSLPPGESPGRTDIFGGFGNLFLGGEDPRKIVALPGTGNFSFQDQWVPVLTTDPNGIAGTASVPGTYNFVPTTGVKDIRGLIRIPVPGVPGTGFGNNPFIAIGAYQYVNLHPPEVTAVTATLTPGAPPVNFYTVGGLAGANKTPYTINITFNEPIDPNSITPSTVNLVNLGSNPSQPLNQPISLAGKLSYDVATDTLIINLGASGLNLGTDAYQITLFGNGSPVITNRQGVALDGENTVNDSPTGATLPLPSGDGNPGGNFFDTFIINTTPPSLVPGSLKLDPASDTNIQGDNITSSTLPTFDGTISESNPTLVPLAGQSAIIDIGVAVLVNGAVQIFFDPSQLTGGLSQYAGYVRPNAGTAPTDASGNFKVTVGIDAANTGLVTNTSTLPDLFPIYNVGSSGILAPVPGTDSGYYVARVRVIDQSGNQSNPNNSNAQLPFIVDTTAPTAQFISPAAGQVITALPTGAISFTITTSKNIDLTHFNASSIRLVNAGPDGILGTADDVTVPINAASISVSYLDQGTGGKGREAISFQSGPITTNGLFQVTLLNTGAGAVRDIAGNLLASPASVSFAVAVPVLAHGLFVGPASAITNPTSPQGTVENPYPTIAAAMAKAVAGDVVAVLPGVYTENVNLKQFVRLFSADPSSTDSTLFSTSTGNPLDTIIRAPFGSSGTATVSATNLGSFVGLPTEIAGFTIASPLLGDPATGIIDPASVGVLSNNSNILIDKNYIADAGNGVFVATTGASAQLPQIENNVIVGNNYGVVIADDGTTSGAPNPAQLINNDFAFNTFGLVLQNVASTPAQAYIANNIFWENHDQSNARNGAAIISVVPDKVSFRNNLFSGNGPSDTSPADDTINVGGGLNPSALGSTPDAEGNYVGKPAFVSPRDPRPGSDGPADLFVDANFDLTTQSAAIDNAWEPTAIPTDILGRSEVKVANHGFGLPDFGPRDVGAYEFDGTGGIAVGGAFRVVTTSLVPVAGAVDANGSTLITPSPPTSIIVTFSGNVDPNSIKAADLVLSGSAVDPSVPAHATSLSWIDAHTVQFNLSGRLDLPGTLNLSINPNTINSTSGQGNMGYSDRVVVQIGTPPPPVNPTPMPTSGTPTPTPSGPVSVSPVPAPAPTAPHHKKQHAVVHHPKTGKHPVHHPRPVKHGAPHPKGAAGLHSKAHKTKPTVTIHGLHKKPSHG